MLNKYHKTEKVWHIRILWIILSILLLFIVSTVMNNDGEDEISHKKYSENGLYSEEKSENSNLEVVVSNQSLVNPTVQLSCLLDGIELFDMKFKAEDQHAVSYFYQDVDEGEHVLRVASEDGQVEEYTFEIGPEKKYFYITYWGIKETAKINIHESDEFIGID